MTRITVHDDLIAEFNSVADLAEICDPSGRRLGHFVPVVVPADPADDRCPYTEEELAKFETQSHGRPLEEIWKGLGRQ